MTETALHQAIIESPDDDLPRLAYADWLDENGDPSRAAHILVQCELARLPEGDPRRGELEPRERELLAAHQEEWVGPLQGVVNGWVFHRGMMGVAVDVRQFLAHAARLIASPLVHYVDVADHAVGRDNLVALAGMPELARVTILDLAGWYCHDPQETLVDDEQAMALATSPYVAGLESLNLRCNAIGDAGVRGIATSHHLVRLRELDLRANRLGDDGVLALAESATLAGLVTLDLSFNDGRVTEAGWRGLARAPGLPRLEGIGLGGNHVSEEVQAALRSRFTRVYC
jgi:uncharacterized protein (TIGR02996 family)